MPPSLELPRPVNDLAAVRKGDRVLLSWSQPLETTDHQNIRRPGLTTICRSVDFYPMAECNQPERILRPDELHSVLAPGSRSHVGFEDVLPPGSHSPTQFAVFAIQALSPHGKSAGLSNQVQVSLAPALPPVSDLRAEVTAESVLLSWTPPQRPVNSANVNYSFRVYRKLVDAPAYTMLREIPLASGTETFPDRTFEWERAYQYKVTGMARVQLAGSEPLAFESEDSPVLRVLPHDIFPPAMPSGLQAVFSGSGQKPFIDLTWAPNMEADLAGYNVFRNELGSAPVQINPQLLKAPAFRDENVVAGHRYIYTVNAVDERGNQSPRSEAATESVPLP
jgi:hypothetical protein